MIKKYNYFKNKLPEQLIKRYGFSNYYNWKQIFKTVEELSPKSLKNIFHAYALFCDETNFNILSKTIDSKYSYNEIRTIYGVPKTNDIPFFNKPFQSISFIKSGENPDAMTGATGNYSH